jgi:hypothetical protein
MSSLKLLDSLLQEVCISYLWLFGNISPPRPKVGHILAATSREKDLHTKPTLLYWSYFHKANIIAE